MGGRGLGGGPRGFLTEEEKQNRPKLTRDLVKRIFAYLKPYLLQFFLVLLAILFAAAIGLFGSTCSF